MKHNLQIGHVSGAQAVVCAGTAAVEAAGDTMSLGGSVE